MLPYTSIDNPLIYRDNDDLKKDVRAFHRRYKLQAVVDELLLLRGARFAQDDYSFKETPGELDEVEKDAIHKEENPKLREQSKELNTILLTCCIGALVQGWAQASIIGANLQWPYAFGLQSKYGLSETITNFWIFGGVNAVTYFAAGSIGCWLSDPLNEYFWGRRGALFIAGLLTVAASIGSACTYDWKALFVGRLFLGIGIGAKASVVPIFESEVAPPNTRGRLLVTWQTFTAIGIMLGSAVNIVFHGPRNIPPTGTNITDLIAFSDIWRQKAAWRLQVASCAIPSVPLLCLAFLCSEYALLTLC